jgi:hypothetical protein
VQIEESGGTVIGRWPGFALEATGDTEAEVYQKMLGGLQQQTGRAGSPEHEAFAACVGEYGRRLSDEEAAARELAQLRDITVRWHATDDEQYMVPLFQDVELHRDGESVTVRAFGLEGSGPHIAQAVRALQHAVSQACGEHDAPRARFNEFTELGAVERRAGAERRPGARSRGRTGLSRCARQADRDHAG